jgi:hypothetical protein
MVEAGRREETKAKVFAFMLMALSVIQLVSPCQTASNSYRMRGNLRIFGYVHVSERS